MVLNKINEEVRRLRIILEQIDIFMCTSQITAKGWDTRRAFSFLKEAFDIADKLIMDTEEKHDI